MFKNIHIKGFRGISELSLDDLRKVNLLVGRNNCGKTSILEAGFIISNPNNAQLAVVTNNLRHYVIADSNGWALLFNKLDVTKTIDLSADLMNPRENRKLKIRAHVQSGALQALQPLEGPIRAQLKDTFSQTEAAVTGIDSEFEISEPGQGKDARTFRSGVYFSNMQVAAATPAGTLVQVPQLQQKIDQHYKETLLAGLSIPSHLLQGLPGLFDKAQNEKRVPEIVSVLRQIEPNLQNLTLSKEGYINADAGLPRLIPINMMGDGMIRLLNYVVLIASCKKGVVFIDEIDDGLHATAQGVLWEAVFGAANRFNVQVIATTHSMECVRAFNKVFQDKPNLLNDDISLIRIEKSDEVFKAVQFDKETLQTALESGWEVR